MTRIASNQRDFFQSIIPPNTVMLALLLGITSLLALYVTLAGPSLKTRKELRRGHCIKYTAVLITSWY